MSFNNKIINKKNKGLTLVEALIVLAIFAGVVAIALNLYNTVTRNSQVGEETTNVSSMFQSMDNFFRRGTTAGLDNQIAINAGFIPSGMSVVAPTIYTSFNGEVNILGNPGTDNKAFSIEYSRVPATACSAFVLGQARVGWDKVNVTENDDPTVFNNDYDGLYFRTNDPNTGTSRGQEVLGEVAIITLCNDGITGDYVNVIFGKDSAI